MRMEIKDSRLNSIIAGAETVFFEKGYTKASISDICKTVNCSRTTLYTHFENKENLYLAVINKSFKVFLDFFNRLPTTGSNGLEKVLGFAKGYINFSQQYPKRYGMILDFYHLLKNASDQALQSDSHLALSSGAFFQKAKKKAELPFSYLVGVIQEGQEDGSINATISAETLFLDLWAYLIGSSQLFSFSSTPQHDSLFQVQLGAAKQHALSAIARLLKS